MTWTLSHRIERDQSASTFVVGQWSDDEVSDIAKNIHDLHLTVSGGRERNNMQEMMKIVKEFLPQPIKDAL